MIYPCKDCKDRSTGCHDTCQKYQEIKKKTKQEKQNRKKQHECSAVAASAAIRCKKTGPSDTVKEGVYKRKRDQRWR